MKLFLFRIAIGLAVLGSIELSSHAVTSNPYLVGATNSASGGNAVSLGWLPSPSPDAAGYFVSWGYASGMATNLLDAGNVTNAVVAGLTTNVTYYFTVIVYSATGQQGPPSNEIQYVPAVTGPVTGPQLYAQVQGNGANAPALILSFQGAAGSSYGVQATQDFINWVTVWTTNCAANVVVSYTPPDLANYPQRFYRLVSQ